MSRNALDSGCQSLGPNGLDASGGPVRGGAIGTPEASASTSSEAIKHPADNATTTVPANGNSISLDIVDSPCPCEPDSVPFVCPVHHHTMRPHWVKLCQTNPRYRQAWMEGRGMDLRPDPNRPPRPRPEPPPPLRQWLTEQLDRLRASEAKHRHYRAPTAALEILDGCCSVCDQYDQRRETCRAVHGCGAVGRYRHSLTTTSGRCPLGVWPTPDQPPCDTGDSSTAGR